MAQKDRWEYIGTDTDGSKYYLDLTTVERPTRGIVIFWVKEEYTNGALVKSRIKMWLGDRKLMRVDKPNYRMEDIVPDTVMEAFYDRLRRNLDI